MVVRQLYRGRRGGIHIDNLRGLLGIRKMDKEPNARIRQSCGVTKGVDEKIDEGILDVLTIWRQWRMT